MVRNNHILSLCTRAMHYQSSVIIVFVCEIQHTIINHDSKFIDEFSLPYNLLYQIWFPNVNNALIHNNEKNVHHDLIQLEMALHANAVRFGLQRICLAPVSFRYSRQAACRLGLEFSSRSNDVSKHTPNVSQFNYQSVFGCVCFTDQ